MTVKDLQTRAAELGINGYTTMKKADLEAAIAAAETAKPAPTPAKAPSLSGAPAKLAWVQQQLRENVAKTARNEYAGYDYFQEHGIFGLVKPYLAEVNLGVTTDFPPELITISGNHIRGSIFITVFDPETDPGSPGFAMTSRYPCGAVDKQDKGDYQMQTQGEKYAWQKMFKVPTEALPDADSSEAVESDAPKAQKAGTDRIPARKAASLRATAQQAVKDKKLDSKAVTAYLTAEFGKNKVTELNAAEGEAFELWLSAQIA